MTEARFRLQPLALGALLLRAELALALSLSLWLSPLSAQTAEGITMQVDAPAGSSCSDEADLRAAVEARLGRSVFSEAGAAVQRVQVHFAHAEQGFGATLLVLDERGKQSGARELHSASPRCSDLDAGLAFVIATLLGGPQASVLSQLPLAPEASPPVLPEPPAAVPPSDQALTPAGQAAEPAASGHERPRFLARAPEGARRHRVRVWRSGGPREPWKLAWIVGALYEKGLLPGVVPGASTGLQAAKGPLLLIAEAVGFPSATTELGEGASAHFTGLFGRVALCGGVADVLGGRASFCGGMRAGVLLIETYGLDVTEREQPPTVQADIGVRYEALRARRVGFYLGLRATMPVHAARPYYEVADKRRYYAEPEPGIGGEFGMIVRPRS